MIKSNFYEFRYYITAMYVKSVHFFIFLKSSLFQINWKIKFQFIYVNNIIQFPNISKYLKNDRYSF